MTTPTLTTIARDAHRSGTRIVAAALGRDHALLATSTIIRVVRFTGSTIAADLEIPLGAAPRSVEVSPSQRFYLAVDAHTARVWNGDPKHPIIELSIDGSATTLGATFGIMNGSEILLHEPRQAALDAYELPSGKRVFSGTTETFLIETAASIAGGTCLALLGYFRGEGKHSLAVVPLDELTKPADVLFARFREKRAIADYAYRLAVGPCGDDALVVFRDPEDDEEPDEYDDDGFVDTTAKADVRGLLGFYVRGFDGALRVKLGWNGPLKSFARLSATASWIAAECGDEIALIPFSSPQAAPGRLPARWLATSPNGSRVLVEMRDGAPGMLALPT